MGKIADATFNGITGSYKFEVFSADTSFNDVRAVYIFTKREIGAVGNGTHTILYIGETESLSERIPNHEKWTCVNRYGANCICVHRDDNDQSRLNKETDLRNGNTTPCNDQ